MINKERFKMFIVNHIMVVVQERNGRRPKLLCDVHCHQLTVSLSLLISKLIICVITVNGCVALCCNIPPTFSTFGK